MIWLETPSLPLFSQAYEGFNLALEGAIGRAVEGLSVRNPRTSMLNGNGAVLVAVNGPGQQLLTRARLSVVEALQLGVTHAEGEAEALELQRPYTDMAEAMVQNITALDRNKAIAIIRNQALAYDLARRYLPHEAAIKKAVGELGNDAFTQLDRANRRFRSADLATGYLRHFMARAYVEAFITVAQFKGVRTADLLTPGEPGKTVEIADFQAWQEEFFHPNTRSTLRMPS